MTSQVSLFATPAHWVEIRCGFLPDTTLWLVPTSAEAVQLEAEGIRPGRIWTLAEVQALLTEGVTREGAELAVRAKLFFDGEVLPVS